MSSMAPAPNAKFRFLAMGGLSLALLGACAPGPRPYYIRSAGGYVRPTAAMTPVAAVPEDLPPAQDTRVARLRRAAEAYIGVRYKLGGQSRRGMDCSGFIRQVFAETYGMSLPRSSRGMWKLGRSIDREDLRPGDLVFFRSMGLIDHSGIYMGHNYFIHSASSVGVSYSTLDAPYFGSRYAGARRLIE
jgi:cell wall-associated NlpC family hydrolase